MRMGFQISLTWEAKIRRPKPNVLHSDFFARALVFLALPAQKNFSQQANILAVLYDVVPKERPREVLRRLWRRMIALAFRSGLC
jgi:hypothetical protein